MKSTKLKINQSGIAHVMIITVIVIVVVIGFIGYRVLQTKDTATPKSASNSTKDSSADTKASNSNSSTKFLTIKEWGVKFALTYATAEAYYDTKTSSNIESMSLRSHNLDTESDCTSKPLSVAGIFRVNKDAINEQTSKKYSEAGDGKVIGDYYYFIQSSQYMCTENTEKAIILQGIRNSFNVSGPTIVKVD